MIESLFIGPRGENADFIKEIWGEIIKRTLKHRQDTFAIDKQLHLDPPSDELKNILKKQIENFFEILQGEVPTFTPRYLGHMLSDVSIPALAGHISVLFCNPNLASKEVAVAGVYLETQAINQLAQMIGFDIEPARGHFTSGGTVANFEALWRARYRFDHWLSLSAYMVEKNLSDNNFFNLAHQGWESFEKNILKYEISDADLRERSYVINGPWGISDYYQEILKQEFPRPVILVPGHKHYSWPKSTNIFGLGERAVWPIELDKYGRVSISSLNDKIETAKNQNRPIMMIVSVAGTTELGSIDAVDEVQDVLDHYKKQEGLHFWHHVDAAYGGYLCSTFKGGKSELSDKSIKSLSAISRADSVTLDPHKLGYVPYACGAFLVREALSYSVSNISAPYLEEDKKVDYPTWSTTLEGSRSATGAGAVWLSSKALPLNSKGHGQLLNQCLQSKKDLVNKLVKEVKNLIIVPGGDSNIASFIIAPIGDSLKQVNALNEFLIHHFEESPFFALSRTSLKFEYYKELINEVCQKRHTNINDNHLTVIRMVIMNPYLKKGIQQNKVYDEFINELNQSITKVPV